MTTIDKARKELSKARTQAVQAEQAQAAMAEELSRRRSELASNYLAGGDLEQSGRELAPFEAKADILRVARNQAADRLAEAESQFAAAELEAAREEVTKRTDQVQKDIIELLQTLKVIAADSQAWTQELSKISDLAAKFDLDQEKGRANNLSYHFHVGQLIGGYLGSLSNVPIPWIQESLGRK